MNWIRIDEGLAKKPQVLQMARALGVRPHEVVGCLLSVWGPLEAVGRTERGDLVISHWGADNIDAEARLPGFAAAMQAAGWLILDEARGEARLPGYERHNGQPSRERRAAGAERARKWRDKRRGKPSRARTERAPSAHDHAHSALPEAKRSEAKRSASAPPPPGGGGADLAKTEALLASQREQEAAAAAERERLRERMARMDGRDLADLARLRLDQLEADAAGGDAFAAHMVEQLRRRTVSPDDPAWRTALAPLLQEAAA